SAAVPDVWRGSGETHSAASGPAILSDDSAGGRLAAWRDGLGDRNQRCPPLRPVVGGRCAMTSPGQNVLLEDTLRRLKLPTMVREYTEHARQAREAGENYEGFLLALA